MVSRDLPHSASSVDGRGSNIVLVRGRSKSRLPARRCPRREQADLVCMSCCSLRRTRSADVTTIEADHAAPARRRARSARVLGILVLALALLFGVPYVTLV